MKWFDNWFRTQSEKAWASASVNRKTPHAIAISSIDSPDESIIDTRNSYHIKMQKATGGTVVEVGSYDSKCGEWSRDLFIISDEKDFVSELTSILVQYKLRHI